MNNRIQEAFDHIHAEEALKARTVAFLAQKAEKPKKPAFRMALSFALFVLLLGVGYWLYFIPTATISIDINPSLELGINRFDRVVSVNGYNEDGQRLAASLHITLLPYKEAIEEILEHEAMTSLLSENAALSVAVIAENQAQSERVLTQVKSCTENHENVHCYSASSDEVTEAHSLGLSYGKYRAFLELKALDPTITPEQIQNMTMREIRNRIASYSSQEQENPEASPSPAAKHEKGNSQGQGNGYGQHNGQGHGKGRQKRKGHR